MCKGLVSEHQQAVSEADSEGKEVESVEFGAKCNNILVNGLSFIEKLSFNAFNEGTRLPYYLKMHRKLFGVDAKKAGGDACRQRQ